MHDIAYTVNRTATPQQFTDHLQREARAALAAQKAGDGDALRTAVMDAIAEALGDAYDCTRVWSAWSYGTMGPDDFTLITDDENRLGEIADAAITAMRAGREE